jgi:hypothetical protein
MMYVLFILSLSTSPHFILSNDHCDSRHIHAGYQPGYMSSLPLLYAFFFTHQLVFFLILLVLEPQLIQPSAILCVKFRFILASARSAPPNDRDLKICSPP